MVFVINEQRENLFLFFGQFPFSVCNVECSVMLVKTAFIPHAEWISVQIMSPLIYFKLLDLLRSTEEEGDFDLLSKKSLLEPEFDSR